MSRLLNVLFPPRCVLCRCEITGEAQVCPNCAEELQGQYQVRQREQVAGCTQTVSALCYRGKIRRALVTCKYGKKMVIGKWGGGQIAACLLRCMPEWKPDLITYVPTTLGHWWNRGFNLSKVFALETAKQCGLPCVSTLHRKWFAKSQLQTHSMQSRRENAVRAYFPRKGCQLTGKRIVLVDDVLTSGATASTCAAILREMGAAEVFFVSLAKTPNNREK
ncbi:MAG: ComF family protein [Butyricicoccus pullicaecorum]|nr:ComF family protein [Butyricicoccus pullicaecorum]